MDRLRSFATHHTWRWRPDPADPDHYLAVETTDGGLRYFAWSHLDARGLTRETLQSFASFEEDGPSWAMPEDVEREVRAWLSAHRPDAET